MCQASGAHARKQNLQPAYLAHSPISRQTLPIDIPLILGGEDYEHLRLLGLPQPNDLPLQLQVLGAIVCEHHYQAFGRCILKSNKKTLKQE